MIKIIKKVCNKILPKTISCKIDTIIDSQYGERITNGLIWSFLGYIIYQGLMLLSSVLVARLLGQNSYGELSIIKSTIDMFTVFAGFGLGLTSTKYISEFKNKDITKTGKIIGLSSIFAFFSGLIISLIIYFSSSFISKDILNYPHIINNLKLGAIIILFSSINGSQIGILSGFEAFKTIAIINFKAGILIFPIQLTCTYIAGVDGALVGYIINYIIRWKLNSNAVKIEANKNRIPIIYKSALSEWKILYKFSLPALLSGLLVSPISWFCNTLLIKQTNGIIELAIFEAANQWRLILLFIPKIIGDITLPLIANSKGNKSIYKQIIKYTIISNILITSIIAIIISIASNYIMNFYGEEYTKGQNVLVILAFTSVLVSINSSIGHVIASQDNMWIGFAFNFLWAILLVISMYFFSIYNLGAYGLAMSYLLSYFIHTIYQMTYLKIKLK